MQVRFAAVAGTPAAADHVTRSNRLTHLNLNRPGTKVRHLDVRVGTELDHDDVAFRRSPSVSPIGTSGLPTRPRSEPRIDRRALGPHLMIADPNAPMHAPQIWRSQSPFGDREAPRIHGQPSCLTRASHSGQQRSTPGTVGRAPTAHQFNARFPRSQRYWSVEELPFPKLDTGVRFSSPARKPLVDELPAYRGPVSQGQRASPSEARFRDVGASVTAGQSRNRPDESSPVSSACDADVREVVTFRGSLGNGVATFVAHLNGPGPSGLRGDRTWRRGS